MTQRISGAASAATRPLSALISATLLLLTVVAGVGGVGGFAAVGRSSGAPMSTAAAATTMSVPATGERRSAPVLGALGSHQHAAGWAPHQPPADVPASDWSPPVGLVAAPIDAGPAVVALTIRVSHRGRAPPAGSLLS